MRRRYGSTGRAKRVGAGPIAENRGVADKPCLLAPEMELVARRLEDELERRPRVEVERHLMGRARRGAGDGAGEAAVDRPVQMAAEDALDLAVAGHDLGKGGGVPRP